MTIRATWNGAVLAESEDAVEVEGHYYFPPEAVNWDHLVDSDTANVRSGNRTVRYYTVEVAGISNRDAAWLYPEPDEPLAKVAGRVAFWKGVAVEHV